ncbi:hypothetical protein DM01DRAFT_1336548 [Hesseltinella vesiculosa]|uniref:Retrotransposon gag domain-containing protein n=1 Tax=Hesseltinella vesiculosa TaxID=101127 RepID=A0A1X2GFQ9_9FUNG|nr:hypothetical protein DM01DRAFT_1336548 [Hesseltinella vesiculosa]
MQSKASDNPVHTSLTMVPFPTLQGNDLMSWLLLFDEALALNQVNDRVAIYLAKIHLNGGALHWAVRNKSMKWAEFRCSLYQLAGVVSGLACFNKFYKETDCDAADRFEGLWLDLITMTRRDSPYRKLHRPFLRNLAHSMYKQQNREYILKVVRSGSAHDLKEVYEFIH